MAKAQKGVAYWFAMSNVPRFILPITALAASLIVGKTVTPWIFSLFVILLGLLFVYRAVYAFRYGVIAKLKWGGVWTGDKARLFGTVSLAVGAVLIALGAFAIYLILWANLVVE